MKVLHYATYNSTPLGFTANKWNHGNKSYGTAGRSGWFVSFCYSWKGSRYIIQLRHDIF